jgi:hypothetical protein
MLRLTRSRRSGLADVVTTPSGERFALDAERNPFPPLNEDFVEAIARILLRSGTRGGFFEDTAHVGECGVG